MHRRTPDARERYRRRSPRQEGHHDDPGPGRVAGARPLERDFVADAPNRTWVADFTHVATWAGTVYVAFVVDAFSRRIIGWSASTSKETQLVLDALEMALRQRDRDQHPYIRGEFIHHSDAGSQYTSFRLAEHLDSAGLAASIHSVGDALRPRTEPHTSSPWP
ncbi:DDE-type integrase/transposase/recombinase [Streptomyces sp. NBC_00435]|uniref:DDE-type integrase/transposase/recombinase n=1 Tax=Streptomyces sp. NBC_00435 TaxID=2903649 RepID=UPI002E22F04B